MPQPVAPIESLYEPPEFEGLEPRAHWNKTEFSTIGDCVVTDPVELLDSQAVATEMGAVPGVVSGSVEVIPVVN